MKQLTLITVALTFVGCVGTIHDPDDTVATYNLYADHLEALLIKECVDVNGVQGCTPQPNLLECTTMTVKVRADGRTWIDCRKEGQVVHAGYARIDEGSPFRCFTNEDMSCQRCVDAFENVILDNCSRGTQLFRRRQVGTAGQGGFLLEPGDGPDGKPLVPGTEPNTKPDPGTTPPDTTGDGNGGITGGSGDSTCNPSNAAYAYANALNKILGHEGLNFSWTPDLSQILDPTQKGKFYGSSGMSGTNNNCVQFAQKVSSHIHQCYDTRNGDCYYCKVKSGKMRCKCYRINLAALKGACKSIPAGCDSAAWSEVMIQAHGLSNKWLFSSSYTNSFYGQVNPDSQSAAPNFPKCMGSPLVLDMAGDGVNPSAPADGVTFDLMATGQLQTAWVAGDDALLALDRDGNGRIDSGVELFGDVTAGVPQQDGFAALAALDANGDGKVDGQDPGYDELVLWQDRNRDGVSQPAELRSLRSAGIASLSTGMTLSNAEDPHGNDLSLRGSFTRADGSPGLMVDVHFVVR
jgi:hypothetical protein